MMITSKLTERSQTTLPAGVRKTLDVGPGEQLGYIIESEGVVRLVNASRLEAEDPVLIGFLEFLAEDLVKNSRRITPFPESLLTRARRLTKGIRIDHDSPIDGAVGI
jgi:antitoxin PrlF